MWCECEVSILQLGEYNNPAPIRLVCHDPPLAYVVLTRENDKRKKQTITRGNTIWLISGFLDSPSYLTCLGGTTFIETCQLFILMLTWTLWKCVTPSRPHTEQVTYPVPEPAPGLRRDRDIRRIPWFIHVYPFHIFLWGVHADLHQQQQRQACLRRVGISSTSMVLSTRCLIAMTRVKRFPMSPKFGWACLSHLKPFMKPFYSTKTKTFIYWNGWIVWPPPSPSTELQAEAIHRCLAAGLKECPQRTTQWNLCAVICLNVYYIHDSTCTFSIFFPKAPQHRLLLLRKELR